MIYAIGDIHGQAEMLETALSLIERDGGLEAEIVFLGDFTDRGPDSKAVLDRLIAGKNAGKMWRFVKGNHDRMFHDYVTEGREHDPHVKSKISWINPRLGGVTTLASYGIVGEPNLARDAPDANEFLQALQIDGDQIAPAEVLRLAQLHVPQVHLQFLSELPLWVQFDDLLFVHAGIRPGIPIEAQVEDDLIWIRDGWLDDTRDHGRLVVHGHTALDHPKHHGNRINLDGGAGYGRPLHPAVFEGRDCWLLTDKGRVPLLP